MNNTLTWFYDNRHETARWQDNTFVIYHVMHNANVAEHYYIVLYDNKGNELACCEGLDTRMACKQWAIEYSTHSDE